MVFVMSQRDMQILKSGVNKRRNSLEFTEMLETTLIVGKVTYSYPGAFKKEENQGSPFEKVL